MSGSIGFLIWCPDHGPPTVVHDTLLAALAEAERLKRLHPSSRFVVMSPVTDQRGLTYARGWSAGRAEGLAQAHREIMAAEAQTDKARDRVSALECAAERIQPVTGSLHDLQMLIADCLLWFDGFAAAHASREPWERPNVPSRERLREFNALLQVAAAAPADPDLDDHIPF